MLDIIEHQDGTVRTEPPGRKIQDVVPELDPVKNVADENEKIEYNLSVYATNLLDKVYAWREDDEQS